MNTREMNRGALRAPAREHTRSQKGSVLVEFAFILPVLLMLLFGVVYFSVALYNKTVLTMATRKVRAPECSMLQARPTTQATSETPKRQPSRSATASSPSAPMPPPWHRRAFRVTFSPYRPAAITPALHFFGPCPLGPNQHET